MTWLSVALTFAAIILVLLQGVSLFWRARNAPAAVFFVEAVQLPAGNSRGFMRIFLAVVKLTAPYASAGGVLNLLLGAGGLLAFLLFRNGALIASPEYGILLVQGPVAKISLYCALVMVSLAAGLIWQTARLAKGLHSHFIWISVVGIAIGLLAAFRICSVNPDDPAAFCIHFYDMWWPPLLLWIMVCVSQWIAIAIGVQDSWALALWGVFFATGTSFIPIYRSLQGLQYGDPSSGHLWNLTLCCGVPAIMAAGPVLLTALLRMQGVVIVENPDSSAVALPSAPLLNWPTTILACLTGFAGVASVVLWTLTHSLLWFFVLCALWALSGLIFAMVSIRRWGPGTLARLKNGDWVTHLLAAIAIVNIGWGVATLSYFTQFDPAWGLTFLIFGWIVLLELIAEFPLWSLRHWSAGPRLLQASTQLLRLGGRTGASAQTPEASKDTSGSKTALKPSWVVKLVIVLAILTIIGEIPNRGKIIVQPFDVLADMPNTQSKDTNPTSAAKEDAREDKRKKDIGQAISDRIANTLALVGEEMRPDLLVLRTGSTPAPPQPELKPKKPWIPATSQEADGLHTTVKSSNVEIPGTNISIPVGFLTRPIQGPMRRILGAQEIQGTIEPDSKQYVMLATSSNGDAWRTRAEWSGDTWRVPHSFLEEPWSGCRSASNGTQNLPQEKEPPAAATNESNPADAVAYMIVTSDERLLKLGMARSWRAVQPFLDGMSAWKKFDQTGDYSFLTRSIEKFRTAICEDPNFALAHYRLGRALTANGQPGPAAAAFRTSLKANPNFVAGHIALANLLYDFDDSYYMAGAEVFDQPGASQNAKCRNRTEATKLWQRVIRDLSNEASVADQAAAYAGLCHSIVAGQGLTDSETSGKTYDQWACQDSEGAGGNQNRSEQWIGSKNQESRYAAFFYCKRAEVLYSKLPNLLQSDEQVQDARASALTQIGQILDGTPFAGDINSTSPTEQLPTKAAKDWSCDVTQDKETKEIKGWFRQKGPYTTFATTYYEQARVIKPDDWKARCYFAIDSKALSSHMPMEKLQADNSMHNVAGNSWWRFASAEADSKKAAPLYAKALVEFKRAVDLFPEDLRSLNDFAYTVWQWHLRSGLPVERLQPEFERWLPEDDNRDSNTIDQLAEEYARRAVLLTQHSDIRTRLMMRSTLQEVLLAKAFWSNSKSQEASKILKKDDIPSHPYFDELRWDAAQARLCINPSRESQKEAAELLGTISSNETSREVRPYTNADKKFKLLTARCQLLKKESPAPTRAIAGQSNSPKEEKHERSKQLAADWSSR